MSKKLAKRPAEGVGLRSHGPIANGPVAAAMACNREPVSNARLIRRSRAVSVQALGISIAVVSCPTKKWVSTGGIHVKRDKLPSIAYSEELISFAMSATSRSRFRWSRRPAALLHLDKASPRSKVVLKIGSLESAGRARDGR